MTEGSRGLPHSVIAAAPPSIGSDRLLLLEGDFDVGFISSLLATVQRAKVQVEAIGGKDNVHGEWRADRLEGTIASVEAWSLARGAERLRWLGIALDADEEPQARLDRAQSAVRLFTRSPMPVPRHPWQLETSPEHGTATTIFVFPDGSSNDDIERYIWGRALFADPFGKCIDPYIAYLLSAGSDPQHEWKARVNCFLHAHPQTSVRPTARERGWRLRESIDAAAFHDLWSQVPHDNW